MANADHVETEILDIKHGIIRNAFYHAARRNWLDGCNRFLSFLIIIGGTSAAADLIVFDESLAKYAAMAVAFIAALQLVYDFAPRARTHEFLQRKYYDLLAEIEEAPAFTEDFVRTLNTKLMRIYGEEPPVMRAADAIADNQASQSMYGIRNRIHVSLWESWTRHIFAHDKGEFPAKDIS